MTKEAEGGDEVCWLNQVCPSCGRLEGGPRPQRCPACGTPFENESPTDD